MQASNPPPRAGRLAVLALLGIFGQAFFVVVVVLLPFFHPDYSSVEDPISRLLLGPYGFVLSGALFAAGLGSLALAVGIRQTVVLVLPTMLGTSVRHAGRTRGSGDGSSRAGKPYRSCRSDSSRLRGPRDHPKSVCGDSDIVDDAGGDPATLHCRKRPIHPPEWMSFRESPD